MKRIIDYSSSSDDEDSQYHGQLPKYQRLSDSGVDCRSTDNPSNEHLEKCDTKSLKKKLQVPSSVMNMFSDKVEHEDVPEIHGGRKRTFPHIRGSWASYIFIPYPSNNIDILKEHISKSLSCLDIKWSTNDDLHITLSRTVSIPHHCIEPLYKELKIKLAESQCFNATLQPNVHVYVNDEKSRTFLALRLDEDSQSKFIDVVQKINTVFKAFRLPPYYDNPSIHISLGWVNGDVSCSNKLPADILLATYHLKNIQKISPHIFEMNIDRVQLKSGNKIMAVMLR